MSIQILASDYKRHISKSGVIMLDVWSSTCSQCKSMSPVLDEVEKSGSVSIIKLQVNDQESLDLARSLGISNIPAFFLYKDGVQIGKKTGIHSKNDMLEWVKSAG